MPHPIQIWRENDTFYGVDSAGKIYKKELRWTPENAYSPVWVEAGSASFPETEKKPELADRQKKSKLLTWLGF